MRKLLWYEIAKMQYSDCSIDIKAIIHRHLTTHRSMKANLVAPASGFTATTQDHRECSRKCYFCGSKSLALVYIQCYKVRQQTDSLTALHICDN